MEHFGREGAEILLVGRAHAGERRAEQGAAVEAAAEGDHARPAGMGAGDLHRVLHRFGAGGEEGGLVRLASLAATADQRVQPRGEFDIGRVGRDLEGGVGDALQLASHRRHYPRVVVAGVQHADAADEIEKALAVHVPHLGAKAALQHDGVRGEDAARHVAVAFGEHRRRAGRVVQHPRASTPSACRKDKAVPAETSAGARAGAARVVGCGGADRQKSAAAPAPRDSSSATACAPGQVSTPPWGWHLGRHLGEGAPEC